MKTCNLSTSLNSSSPLHRFRDKDDQKEPANMVDINKDGNLNQIDADTLQEMEVRTKSRLSAYGEAIDSPRQDDLSKSYHSISYSASPCPNAYASSPAHRSLNSSWQFYNFVGGEEADTTINTAYKKPTQAIITINARTSRILVANETACDMFGYTEEELCTNMKMSQLFTMEDGIKQNVLIEQNVDTNGNIVMVSGKVLEAVNSKGDVFMVSVWMKRIRAGNDARCIIILESVDVKRATFLFDADGSIIDCDFVFALLHGYEDPQEIAGQNIHQYIPLLTLPKPGESLTKEVRKQRVTDRTKELIPFPSTVKIRLHDPDFHELYIERTPEHKRQNCKFQYKGFLWVFSNISGLLTINTEGLVTGCNDNFLRIFLGYLEKELLGQEVATLIPHFYEQIDMLNHDLAESSLNVSTKHTGPRIEKDLKIESLDDSVTSESTIEDEKQRADDSGFEQDKQQTIDKIKEDGFSPHSSTPKSQNALEIKHELDVNEQKKLFPTEETMESRVKTSDYESLSSSVVDDVLTRLTKTTEYLTLNDKTGNSKTKIMSTPCKESNNISDLVFEDCKKDILDSDKGNLNKIFPGQYYGQAKHKDGSMLPILFEIKKVTTKEKGELFCLWISRDPDEECEQYSTEKYRQLLASFNSTMNASTGNFQEMLKEIQDMKVDDPGHGPYNDHFVTVKCIGKGAFGFVNLAERKTNKEQVVVKFIRKEKVLKDSWINDMCMGRIPYEVYLLSKLRHPNIVVVLEAYENDNFFQMVMEKHGDGIDLFEFIDRKPLMDEALASYMFRQVLSATSYLHENDILHRDIKDENIIVDRSFNLKLIDFGSAAPLDEKKYFSTFCGTIEYCSPEVLLGNWYRGPELEMWSLGVTLYTFIFGEHPFFEVEDTIRAEIFPPFKVSNELMFVVCWMLHPEVEFRAKLSDLIKYPWFTRDVDISDYDYDTVLSGQNDFPNEDTTSPRKEVKTTEIRKSSSNNSSLSSSSSSLSSSSIDDLASSHDSELERNQQLMREEYKKYLNDPKSSVPNSALSKSF